MWPKEIKSGNTKKWWNRASYVIAEGRDEKEKKYAKYIRLLYNFFLIGIQGRNQYVIFETDILCLLSAHRHILLHYKHCCTIIIIINVFHKRSLYRKIITTMNDTACCCRIIDSYLLNNVNSASKQQADLIKTYQTKSV